MYKTKVDSQYYLKESNFGKSGFFRTARFGLSQEFLWWVCHEEIRNGSFQQSCQWYTWPSSRFQPRPKDCSINLLRGFTHTPDYSWPGFYNNKMMILEMLVFRDWYNLSLGLDEPSYPELQIKCWGTSTWVVRLLNDSDT